MNNAFRFSDEQLIKLAELGITAGMLESRGEINLPCSVDGEERWAAWAVTQVCNGDDFATEDVLRGTFGVDELDASYRKATHYGKELFNERFFAILCRRAGFSEGNGISLPTGKEGIAEFAMWAKETVPQFQKYQEEDEFGCSDFFIEEKLNERYGSHKGGAR